MLSYVEDEESYGGQVVLDEVMMFEDPTRVMPMQQGIAGKID